jgi:hypothetical protein
MRSFVIRDIIYSALITKSQNDASKRGQAVTFSMNFSPDLTKVAIEIPVQQTESATLLIGKIPEQKRSSLRAAIEKHRPALASYMGVSPRIDGHDEEYFYQNTLNRFVRPTLCTAHILQVVWEAAVKYQDEAAERQLPIDQILMRKATWAENIDKKTEVNAGMAIFDMRELGIESCSCKLVHIGAPAPDSGIDQSAD